MNDASAEPRDDDDPRQGVDVAGPFEVAVPPRQQAEQLVEVARVGREEERPTQHARDRGNHDRQDRDHSQHAELRRQRVRRPGEPGSDDERDHERAEAELDRPFDRRPPAGPRVCVAVRLRAVLQREVLQADERPEREVAEPADEGDQPDLREDPFDAQLARDCRPRDRFRRHVRYPLPRGRRTRRDRRTRRRTRRRAG